MPKPTPVNNSQGQQKLPECTGDFELDAALALVRQHAVSGLPLIDPKVQQAQQLIELRLSSRRVSYR